MTITELNEKRIIPNRNHFQRWSEEKKQYEQVEVPGHHLVWGEHPCDESFNVWRLVDGGDKPVAWYDSMIEQWEEW